jgi:ADP-ribose pyrophosphatase YjhB (NUDIX family)
MTATTLTQRTSLFLRRFPWLFTIAHAFWRLFQAKYSVGAVGVVFNEEDKVLLAKHAFHPKYPWALPGGWVDRNEDPAITVCREMLEELMLDVEVYSILLVETPYKNHLDLAYLCRALNEVGKLSYELLDYGWFGLDELPPMLDVHHRAIEKAILVKQTMETEA